MCKVNMCILGSRTSIDIDGIENGENWKKKKMEKTDKGKNWF